MTCEHRDIELRQQYNALGNFAVNRPTRPEMVVTIYCNVCHNTIGIEELLVTINNKINILIQGNKKEH